MPNVVNERHTRCLRCAAGLGRSDDGTSCIPCNSGYFSREGVCESCQPPRVVKADKNCSFCEDGKHAFGGVCVDCVGATYATAGTTAGVCKACEAPGSWMHGAQLARFVRQANRRISSRISAFHAKATRTLQLTCSCRRTLVDTQGVAVQFAIRPDPSTAKRHSATNVALAQGQQMTHVSHVQATHFHLADDVNLVQCQTSSA